MSAINSLAEVYIFQSQTKCHTTKNAARVSSEKLVLCCVVLCCVLFCFVLPTKVRLFLSKNLDLRFKNR